MHKDAVGMKIKRGGCEEGRKKKNKKERTGRREKSDEGMNETPAE